MCGRFTLEETIEAVENVYQVASVQTDIAPTYNAAPRQTVAAIVNESGDAGAPPSRILEGFQWGLVPPWTKELAKSARPINVRVETIEQRPTYRPELKSRRCIIPASGFYEWEALKGSKVKQPWYFHVSDGMAGFAGLWDEWRETRDSEPLRTCTIITMPPIELVAPVHDRMPALLSPSAGLAWLDPATPPQDALALLVHENLAPLEKWPVSARVGNVKENDPELVAPIG